MHCLPSMVAQGDAARGAPLSSLAAAALLEVATAADAARAWRSALTSDPFLAWWARDWGSAPDRDLPCALAERSRQALEQIRDALRRKANASPQIVDACRRVAERRLAAAAKLSTRSWRRKLSLLADDPEDLFAAAAGVEHGAKTRGRSRRAPSSDALWRPADDREAAVLSGAIDLKLRAEATERDFAERLWAAKLDALKELAYGASHEVNNPLANISMTAQSLLVGEQDEERRLRLGTIHAQAMRAHEMISDLMYFARPPRAEPRAAEVADLVRRALTTVAGEAAGAGVAVETIFPSSPTTLWADPEQIVVALSELLRNAVEAQPQGGRVQVFVEQTSPADAEASGGETWFRFVDQGPGVAAEAREHLFDPFFSGREAGRGLGFGLCKAWRIAEMHGGRIECLTPEVGAEFLLVVQNQAPDAEDA